MQKRHSPIVYRPTRYMAYPRIHHFTAYKLLHPQPSWLHWETTSCQLLIRPYSYSSLHKSPPGQSTKMEWFTDTALHAAPRPATLRILAHYSLRYYKHSLAARLQARRRKTNLKFQAASPLSKVRWQGFSHLKLQYPANAIRANTAFHSFQLFSLYQHLLTPCGLFEPHCC